MQTFEATIGSVFQIGYQPVAVIRAAAGKVLMATVSVPEETEEDLRRYVARRQREFAKLDKVPQIRKDNRRLGSGSGDD